MKSPIFKTFNPNSRKFELICLDEAEIVPGMRLVKLHWCGLAQKYVTIPGASLFVVNSSLEVVPSE